jgi:hypothetical protein
MRSACTCLMLIAWVWVGASCAHHNDSPTVAMVRAEDEPAAESTPQAENETREADEPGTRAAEEPWPVEDQPAAGAPPGDSQVAIDDGSLAAADEARQQPEETKEASPATPACETLSQIDMMNGLMDRERRIEQDSGVTDLSARRKYGGMIVVLKNQLAAQRTTFKRLTGRALERKRDCVEQPGVVNASAVEASETKSKEPEERLRARSSVCNSFRLIEIYNGQMKRQRAIERESGVEDLDAKRRIGEALVLAKDMQTEALSDFKRLWKRSFKRATDCTASP